MASAITVIWDHPRICGEKCNAAPHGQLQLGSPPHMRGKEPLCCLPTVLHGITPAYAGKRPQAVPGVVPVQDHPRICGEKSFHSVEESAFPGSPPHMRGKD